MKLALKPQFQKFVEKQVKLGRYESVEDMLTAGVARLMQDDEVRLAPGELGAMLDRSEADIAAGRVFTVEQVREHFNVAVTGTVESRRSRLGNKHPAIAFRAS